MTSLYRSSYMFDMFVLAWHATYNLRTIGVTRLLFSVTTITRRKQENHELTGRLQLFYHRTSIFEMILDFFLYFCIYPEQHLVITCSKCLTCNIQYGHNPLTFWPMKDHESFILICWQLFELPYRMTNMAKRP